MKFLKLRLDDLELYNVKSSDEKATYLYTNMPAFRRLYSDQGETFWLRHLLTFREYFYILIRAKFQHENGQCLHWIINPMEKTFIRIHKLLFVGGFDAAKQNLKIIKKHVFKLDAICPLITNSQCRLIASSSVKNAFKTLFGSHLGHDKIAIIKAFLASGLYKHFCGSLGVLLKRCDVTIDMPSSFDDACPNTQYWVPFPYWTKDDYEPNLFENYIAHHYGDRLPKMLLTSDVNLIFHSKHIHACCEIFISDYGSRLIEESEKYQRKEYVRCDDHPICYMRLVHSESCKNPYTSCLRKPRCSLQCDSECIRKNMESKYYEDPWKQGNVKLYDRKLENRRDVQVLVEMEKPFRTVETYLCHTVDYGHDWSDGEQSPFWRSLPPDLMNFAKQIKRKEKTKSRLRDKLSKKAKQEAKKKEDALNAFQFEHLQTWETHDFRLMLFFKAQKRFKEELGDELMCRILQGKIGNTDNPLEDLFEEKLDLEYLLPRLIGNGLIIVNKNYRSIGVGCDIPLDEKFLPELKRLHIQDQLMQRNMCTRQNIPQEISEAEELTKYIDDILSKDTLLKKTIAEGGTLSCSTYVDKDGTKIEYIHQKTEISGKERIELKKNKKSGKKSQKTQTHYDHARRVPILTIDEESFQLPCNGIHKDLTVTHCVSSEGHKHSDSLNDKDIEEAIRNTEIIKLILKEDELEENKMTRIEITPKFNQKSNIMGKIEKGEIFIKQISRSQKNSEDSENVKEGVIDNTVQIKNVIGAVLKENEIENKIKSKLRICGHCDKQEPTRRTFKKCKLCKDSCAEDPRYYCSKDCQVTDWKRRHEADHQKNVQ